jgi:hypothetical protein
MNKINILLTGANGNLSDKKEMIGKAVKVAEEYVFPKLKIDWDIDVLITNRLYDLLIPEDGVGGLTITADFIEFAVSQEKATEYLISEMLVHELCHAARWGKNNERITSLFDGIISEGIATYFEAEFIKNRNERTVFIQTILERSNEENEKILDQIRDSLNSNKYNYGEIFFTGNNMLPRWSGYSLGFYLVKKYLEKTGKTIEEAFADKNVDFKISL